MSAITVTELAKHILVSFADKDVTPMKLQKLAYYVKVWTLVAKFPVVLDSDGNNAQFVRWDYGPVNRELYDAYKQFGNRAIKISDPAPAIDDEDAEVINFILENYVDYSAVDLSMMTHNEVPWQQTNTGRVIPDSVIVSYYGQEPFAKNFENFDLENSPFYMLRDQTWHAFTMDMSAQDKELSTHSPSYAFYKALKQKAEADLFLLK